MDNYLKYCVAYGQVYYPDICIIVKVLLATFFVTTKVYV